MASKRTTKALVLVENGAPLEPSVLEVTSPGSHQALVEMVATGICHTDLICASKNLPFPTPSILGHEGAGVVVEVGDALTDRFACGDKVILSFNYCGHCTSCKINHPAYCHSFRTLNAPGVNHDGSPKYDQLNPSFEKPVSVLGGFFGQSSFAKVALVEGNSMTKVNDVSRKELIMLAPLGCGIQTGTGSVINSLQVQKGASFAVFGAGAVGLSALIAAKLAGADPVISIDLLTERLELARELGATHTIRGDADDIVEKIREITSSTNGVSYAVDATGVLPVIESMLHALGYMGKAVSIGVPPPGIKVAMDLSALMERGLSYAACTEGDSSPEMMIPYLVSEYHASRLPLEKLVTTYSVTDFQRAMEDMKSGKVIKPVVIWD